jgi:hypothetical protein
VIIVILSLFNFTRVATLDLILVLTLQFPTVDDGSIKLC